MLASRNCEPTCRGDWKSGIRYGPRRRVLAHTDELGVTEHRCYRVPGAHFDIAEHAGRMLTPAQRLAVFPAGHPED
jgi:hypothetical protein